MELLTSNETYVGLSSTPMHIFISTCGIKNVYRPRNLSNACGNVKPQKYESDQSDFESSHVTLPHLLIDSNGIFLMFLT